jgi:hypothetical protein
VPAPTFVNCAFTNGFASNRGGGVRVAAGSPSFVDCRFEGNAAVSAGRGLAAANVGTMLIRNGVIRAATS